jgi:hypothetical protein
MRPTYILVPSLVFCLTTGAIAAPEVKKPDEYATLSTSKGKTYEKAVVSAVDPDGLRIMHKDGAAKIPFEQLSEDLQKKYGFDPVKAVEFQAENKKALELADAEVRAYQAKEAEKVSQSEFQLLRRKLLVGILNNTNLVGLMDSLQAQIAIYKAEGREEWVKLLEGDQELLRTRIALAPVRKMEEENARLQAQIENLNGALRDAERRRVVVVRDDPFTTRSYYVPNINPYYNPQYNPPVVVPRRPTVVPCPVPNPMVQTIHDNLKAGMLPGR